VRIAEKFGASIVSYEWLVDSIKRGERLPENRYSMRFLACQHKRKQRQKKIEQEEKVKQGLKEDLQKQGMSEPCQLPEAQLDRTSGSTSTVSSPVVELPGMLLRCLWD